MQTTIRLFSLCLLILGFYTCQPTPEKKQPVDWVDPQIGSVHCRWFFYTPAALPMGMAKLAPTTNAYGSYGSWLPCGYDDRHTSIEGFAHFHEFQIGGVVTIPTTGELKTLPGTLENPDAGYRSRVDKTTEVSTPGYYAVTLTDYNIKAEITATPGRAFTVIPFPNLPRQEYCLTSGTNKEKVPPSRMQKSHITRKPTKSPDGWKTIRFMQHSANRTGK